MDSTGYSENTVFCNRHHLYAGLKEKAPKNRICRVQKDYRKAFAISKQSEEKHQKANRAERSAKILSGKIKSFFASVPKAVTDNDTINSNIAKISDWLEVDDKDLRVEGTKKKIPAKFVTAIAVISLSLLLIVSGAVISSNSSMQLYASENRLEQLKQEQTKLERELELKNDLRYIENVARTKLGMIDHDFGAVRCINRDKKDKVEIYEDKSSPNKFSAILDALKFVEE